MQTNTHTPKKQCNQMLPSGFVTYGVYLIAGKKYLKSDYRKGVKSKMATND